jgi:hypothetical protein
VAVRPAPWLPLPDVRASASLEPTVSPATRWRALFLGLTALVVGMEIWASADGDPDTDPWTDLITDYVPAEVTFALIGALVLWLPVHFGVRYWRKRKADKID